MFICREMWKYLEHINIILNGVVQVMRDLPRSEVVYLASSNNLGISRGVKNAIEQQKIMTSHRSIPFVTNQDGELDPGVLVYVLEGILPLIKV